MSDVLEMVQDAKRPIVEGERILDSNLLVTVGKLASSSAHIVRVWALCMQTSALSSHPHKLEAKLNLRNILKRVVNISCSCKADTSEKCQHCVALLIHLNRLRNPDELEDLSCTDLAQQWGKMKKTVLSQYDAVPITEFCHFVRPQQIYAKGVPQVSEELASQFVNLIIEKAQSEAHIHLAGIRKEASQKNLAPIEDDVAKQRKIARDLTVTLLHQERSTLSQTLKRLTETKINGLPQHLQDFYRQKIQLTDDECLDLAFKSVL